MVLSATLSTVLSRTMAIRLVISTPRTAHRRRLEAGLKRAMDALLTSETPFGRERVHRYGTDPYRFLFPVRRLTGGQSGRLPAGNTPWDDRSESGDAVRRHETWRFDMGESRSPEPLYG